MSQPSWSRRQLLKRVALAVWLVPLAVSVRRARAANLLSPASPQAKAVRYVEDARSAKGAIAGSTCANCALYQGASGAPQGPCQIFPGQEVKAQGWCSSWSAQM